MSEAMSQAMQGPYVNGAPDSPPDGYQIPWVTIEFHHSTPMLYVQRLIALIEGQMKADGVRNVRIECNFLELLDSGAPDYNISEKL